MLQWSNSQMLRFVRAADLRAEWDNVRRKEKAVDRTADYRCLLLFLSRRRAEQSRAGGRFGVMPASVTAAFSLARSFSSLASLLGRSRRMGRSVLE